MINHFNGHSISPVCDRRGVDHRTASSAVRYDYGEDGAAETTSGVYLHFSVYLHVCTRVCVRLDAR